MEARPCVARTLHFTCPYRKNMQGKTLHSDVRISFVFVMLLLLRKAHLRDLRATDAVDDK